MTDAKHNSPESHRLDDSPVFPFRQPEGRVSRETAPGCRGPGYRRATVSIDDAHQARSWLVWKLEEAADFRREKMTEYPGDERNKLAAELADRLTAQLLKMDHDDQRLIEIARLETTDAIESCGMELQRYFGRLGFDHFPESAAELLEDYAAILRENAPEEVKAAAADPVDESPATDDVADPQDLVHLLERIQAISDLLSCPIEAASLLPGTIERAAWAIVSDAEKALELADRLLWSDRA